MRSIWKTVALATAGLLFVPQLAAAADLEAEVADMKKRMEVMEDQIRVQNDELAEAQATVEKQTEVIEKAGLEEREDVSALSAFIESTDFNAWVAVSYNYNFQGSSDAPGGGTLPANAGMPHHPFSNTFQLDQAWIEIDKAPTEESRAGGHIDLQAGVSTTTAGVAPLVAAPPVGIYSAYVSYLAPIWKGVQIDGGILPTILGAEVEQTNANFNITRGRTWGLQPVTNTGFLVSMDVIDGFTVQAGMLNEPIAGTAVDVNRGKALTSKVSYSAEKFGASVGVNWGRAGAGGGAPLTNVSTGIADVILSVDPTDNLSAYINYDYVWTTANNFGTGLGNTSTHAVSVAGRLGILDSTGLALRYEYIHAAASFAPTAATAHTITGTVDHGLTDNLTMKVEVRYDHTTPGTIPTRTPVATPPTAFPTRQGQTVALAQLLYEF